MEELKFKKLKNFKIIIPYRTEGAFGCPVIRQDIFDLDYIDNNKFLMSKMKIYAKEELQISKTIIKLNDKSIYPLNTIVTAIPESKCTKCNKTHLNVYFTLLNNTRVELCEINDLICE